MRSITFILLSLLLGATLHGQTDVVISEEDFLRQVLLYHPALRSAELNVELANADEMGARAAFDPVWKTEYAGKDYEGKEYYDYQHTSLDWELPPGIGIKVGGDRVRGDFINPELTTPADGLVFAELSVPVLDGLFRTESLTRLQAARIQSQRAVRQLQTFKRDLATYAAEVYWNWVASSQEIELRTQVRGLAEIRYDQTVRRFEQGAATAMDTLEALNNYYMRQTELLAAQSENESWYRLAGTMIWKQQWISPMRAGSLSADSNEVSVASLALRNPQFDNRSPLVNPILEDLDLKFKQSNLELRLAREQVKPDLDLSAKLISEPTLSSISSSNAVLGFSAKLPLLSRKERANIRKARIKQEQSLLKITEKEREMLQKFDQFDRQVSLNRSARDIASSNAMNAFEILQMENKRLLFGESTLFKVNVRENYYIDAEIKRIDVDRKQKILEWKLLMLTLDPEEVITQ